MPFYRRPTSLPARFRVVLSSFLQHEGLPFSQVLSAEQIEQAFDEQQASFGQEEDAVFTPEITLWAFLSQTLAKDEHRSCVAAVARVITLLVALGEEPCSEDTGAYCRARAKLDESVLERLVCRTADECEAQLPAGWLWKGRHVKLVDGSTVSMPDTPENQAEYPQPDTQQPGVGFPLARLVVLLSLSTAMLSGMAIGPYSGKETGETALLRQLFEHLDAGDVLLADRCYCSYFLIALLMELGVDVVTRLHQCRTADFRRGRRLGKGDHVVVWNRPARPDWMDQQTYDRMPESITVREVQVNVSQPGFRVESFVVVTTLLDERKYAREDIAELYHERWLVELDIRAIKGTLGLDVLRCKSPAMVRRELWTGLLAYNLIRRTLLQAAQGSTLSPRQLSFTAAMQKIEACWTVICVLDEATAVALIDVHLAGLLKHRVGHRPDRIEPRKVKRRPKSHQHLTQPRALERAELLGGRSS